MSVRAKFRCMSVTDTWDEVTVVTLRPVWRHGGNEEENKAFWVATPAGEAELAYVQGVPRPIAFKPGDYYFIDWAEDGDGDAWKCTVKQVSEIQVDVVFYPVSGHGTIKMSILNPAAHFQFLPGQIWKVTFTHAEVSDWTGK